MNQNIPLSHKILKRQQAFKQYLNIYIFLNEIISFFKIVPNVPKFIKNIGKSQNISNNFDHFEHFSIKEVFNYEYVYIFIYKNLMPSLQAPYLM